MAPIQPSSDHDFDSVNNPNKNKKQKELQNENNTSQKKEEKPKEKRDYWDRITDDPASGYGADRSEEDTLQEDQ